MATDTGTNCDCPSTDALRGLIRGRLSDPEQAELTHHLDDCPECQAKLENLAADGDPKISDAVRHVNQTIPPQQSAYWRALQDAETNLTQSVDTARDTDRTGEFSLDF